MERNRIGIGAKIAGLGLMAYAFVGAAVGAPWFADDQATASLDQAHEAFLARDYGALTASLRETLGGPEVDSVVRQNALDLLAKAAEETQGNLPVNWTPPPGVSDLKFTQSLKQEPDGLVHKIKIRGDLAAVDTLKQVQVVRFPDLVVLDRQAGLGEYSTSPEAEGAFSFDLEREMPAALQEDLYIVRFELKDGTQSEGWFIVDDLAASTTPNLISPAVGETFRHGHPEFVFEDFRSPEYKSYEIRRLNINAARLIPTDPGWDLSWGFYVRDPDLTRITVGPHPDALGVDELEPGRYWVSVEFLEERRFGPMKLRRGAKTGRPIYIRAD